jgi:poly-D-alanine transfer protein DltD
LKQFFEDKLSKKKYRQIKRYLKLQNKSVISLTYLQQLLSEKALDPEAKRIFENNDQFIRKNKTLKRARSSLLPSDRLEKYLRVAGNFFKKNNSLNLLKVNDQNEYYSLLLDNIR